jgi:hypothetical protein
LWIRLDGVWTSVKTTSDCATGLNFDTGIATEMTLFWGQFGIVLQDSSENVVFSYDEDYQVVIANLVIRYDATDPMDLLITQQTAIPTSTWATTEGYDLTGTEMTAFLDVKA